MKKINVVYWSGTGNTEQMAKLIEEGAKQAGAEVVVSTVSNADKAALLASDVLVLGCPSMGAEVLEEDEFEPFMVEIEPELSGKKVALFGSYGWGDGEWMRDWEKRIKDAGAEILDEPVIIQETPDAEGENTCKEFGKFIAA